MVLTVKHRRNCWNSGKEEHEAHKILIMLSITYLTQVSTMRAVFHCRTADKLLMHRKSNGDLKSEWLSKLAAKCIWQIESPAAPPAITRETLSSIWGWRSSGTAFLNLDSHCWDAGQAPWWHLSLTTQTLNRYSSEDRLLKMFLTYREKFCLCAYLYTHSLQIHFHTHVCNV